MTKINAYYYKTYEDYLKQEENCSGWECSWFKTTINIKKSECGLIVFLLTTKSQLKYNSGFSVANIFKYWTRSLP